MSRKELIKEDLKYLSHDDLIRLGASLAIKHVSDSSEKNECTKKEVQDDTKI